MNWLFNKIPSHSERHATMIEINDSAVNGPTPEVPHDALTEILRAGAQKMLAAAIEREVASYPAMLRSVRSLPMMQVVGSWFATDSFLSVRF
jgi:hypothetical protein